MKKRITAALLGLLITGMTVCAAEKNDTVNLAGLKPGIVSDTDAERENESVSETETRKEAVGETDASLEDHPEPAPAITGLQSENTESYADEADFVPDSIDEKNEALQELYKEYLETNELTGQKWSLSIENLQTGEITSWNENRLMQSASVIKVFIMGAIYDRVCYPSSEEKKISYQESYDGELKDLLQQMITVSSNEAANSCILILGNGNKEQGFAVLNAFCQENGYTHTSAGRLFLESNPSGDNYTTAADCRKILADIYEGKCVNEEASAKMLEILKGQTVRYKIPAGLPSGYSSANKTGEMPEGYGLGCIENDIAIVFSPKGDYVLSVLSNDLGGSNSEADETITKISSYVADHQEEIFEEVK